MSSTAAHLRYQSKLFPGSSHSWVLDKLKALPANAAVLDIGPGSGIIGQALRSQGISDLTAVEIDPAAREHARSIYTVVSADLESVGRKDFDVVLLLDVIEHMAQPEKFLLEVTSHVKRGGLVLISVPNIAHWAVRFQLLFGFFNYTERGLLDRTHLQFFTRSRVRNFTRISSELEAVEYNSSIPPVEFVLPEWFTRSRVFEWLSRAHLATARFWPGMFGYQHLCVLRKR